MNNQDPVQDAIMHFLTFSPTQMERVREAVRDESPSRLREEARALKRLAENVGSNTLAQTARALETIGEQGDIASAEGYWVFLEQEYFVASEILAEVFEALNRPRRIQ